MKFEQIYGTLVNHQKAINTRVVLLAEADAARDLSVRHCDEVEGLSGTRNRPRRNDLRDRGGVGGNRWRHHYDHRS